MVREVNNHFSIIQAHIEGYSLPIPTLEEERGALVVLSDGCLDHWLGFDEVTATGVSDSKTIFACEHHTCWLLNNRTHIFERYIHVHLRNDTWATG